MTAMIHIVKTPDGEGYGGFRTECVGCTFRLAEGREARLAQEPSAGDEEAPSVYVVAFDDFLEGLARSHCRDWIGYFRSVVRPNFIRFPVDCAELIGTT